MVFQTHVDKSLSQNVYVEKISVCHAMIKILGRVWLLFHIEACYHTLILFTKTDNFIMLHRMALETKVNVHYQAPVVLLHVGILPEFDSPCSHFQYGLISLHF